MTERHKLRVAVYIFLIKDEQILLSRRFNTGWMDGKYSLPAGHLDPDETIVSGLLREVNEEIGVTLNIEDVELVHTMHRMNMYIDFFFVCKNWQGEIENKEIEKCDELKWSPINDLPENMVPSVRHAIGQYKQGILFSEFENEG